MCGHELAGTRSYELVGCHFLAELDHGVASIVGSDVNLIFDPVDPILDLKGTCFDQLPWHG